MKKISYTIYEQEVNTDKTDKWKDWNLRNIDWHFSNRRKARHWIKMAEQRLKSQGWIPGKYELWVLSPTKTAAYYWRKVGDDGRALYRRFVMTKES